MATDTRMNRDAWRILRVLREGGPRKTTVLLGIIKSAPRFERAVGQLFLVGVVRWISKKRGRLLASVSR